MKRVLLICALMPFILGTTFVIKENGAEVGRWEEADGKHEVQVISNEVKTPSEKPQVLKDPIPDTSGVGYGAIAAPRPEGEIAMWKVSGRVMDIVTLAGLQGGKVIFAYGTERIEAPVGVNGSFQAKLPSFENGGYSIAVEGVTDYDVNVRLRKKGGFSGIPYTERLHMGDYIQFGTFDDMVINATTYDIQIGLMPLKLTRKQQEDYNRSGSY